MSGAPTSVPPSKPTEGARQTPHHPWVVGAIGVLLLAAAAWMLVQHAPAVREAGAALGAAPWWYGVLLLTLPLVNIAAVTMGFWVMTEPHARKGVLGTLGLGEMGALITSGWMLNSLPFRPGLVGRVAYHGVVNGVPVRTSIGVLLQVLACAGAALGVMLGSLYAAHRAGVGGAMTIVLMLVPVASMAGISAVLRRAHPGGRAWRWAACIACRLVDIGVWALRYALIFGALGEALRPLDAGVIASASEAAMLSPVQIGLREWVVGLTSAWLAGSGPWMIEGTSVSVGVLADLINRGVEVVLGVPLGLLAGAWLSRRLMAARARQPGSPEAVEP